MNFEETIKEIIIEQRILDDIRQKYIGDDKIPESVYNDIVKLTGNKIQYIVWLVKMSANKIIKIEDLYKYEEYLKIFTKYKNLYREKDINKYVTKQDLNYFLDTTISIMEKDVQGNNDNKTDNYVSIFNIKKLNDVGIMYHGIVEGFQVFEVPNELSNDKEAYNVYKNVLAKCAGRKEGAQIHICTMASQDYFKDYLERYDGSSYFVMYNMNDPLSPYQFHYESGELRDKNNKMVSEVMDIKKIINIDNFINTKNQNYSLNNVNYLQAILDNIFGEHGAKSALQFFENLIKHDEIEITPEILAKYIEFYSDEYCVYDDYDLYNAFKNLYDKNKIKFELNGDIINKIVKYNENILKEMIDNNIVPINNELYKSLANIYEIYGSYELLDYIKSKKPDFFMLKRNKDIDYLLGFVRNKKTGEPLLNDKFFIKSLYNEQTVDYDPYYILSKIVSYIAAGKNIKNILKSFGEIGKRFYKDISSGDAFLFSGYYDIIFKNNYDFYYLADVFGEVAASNYFINLITENEYGFSPKKYKIKEIAKLDVTRGYIKNMKTFWNFVKENYPNKYENIYDSLVNNT